MENINIISLKERDDRRSLAKEQLKGLNKITFSIVDAIKSKPGWIGCALSHINVIEEAKKRGDKYVIVFEDDFELKTSITEFEDRMLKIISFCQDESNNSKWNILLLGCNLTFKNTQHIEEINSDLGLYKIQHAFCAHAIIWSERVFDTLIKLKDKYKNGEMKIESKCAIDVIMNQVPNLITIYPFLAYQRPGVSDILHRSVNYTKLFNISQEMLRKSRIHRT